LVWFAFFNNVRKLKKSKATINFLFRLSTPFFVKDAKQRYRV
jgi:signal transduction histidine kinase